jgi:hypothetical protein
MGEAGGMSSARTFHLAGLVVVLGCVGCVDRKFVIESNVPNAQVYIDNKSVGAAPAYVPFEYYGNYTITVVHPGYETIVKRVHVTAPWYAYPPIDFLAEALLPFHIRDTRRYYFELYEATQTRTDDILNAADALRQRGMMLPPPERPAQPRPNPQPPTGVILGPPVVPTPGPGPGPGPVAPAPGPAPGVVPSVTPGYTPPSGTTYFK